MKPRIYKRAGLWYCKLLCGFNKGIGYTPSHAYSDWQKLQGMVIRT